MSVIDALVATAAPLFDPHGRRVVADLSAPAHRTVRRRFICVQPSIDYGRIHSRISRHLDCVGAIAPMEFRARVERILSKIADDERCAALTNAVAVPFFLPRTLGSASADMGAALEARYLPALERSFTEAFPGRTFVNHHKPSLAGKLSVAPGSRHDRLLAAMDTDVVVGVVFVSLTEFSIPAAIEQMADLPPGILLSGGVDLSAALVGSPDLLLRTDGYPPLIWLAGLQTEPTTAGFYFEAYGYDLTFNRRVHFSMAAEYWACALTVTG